MVTAGGGVAHGAGRARHDRCEPAVIIVAIVLLTLSPGLAPCPVKMSEINSSFLDSLIPKFLGSNQPY